MNKKNKCLIVVLLMTFVLLSIVQVNFVSSLELNPFANKKIFEKSYQTNPNDFIKEKQSEFGVIQLSRTFFWVEGDKIAEYRLDNVEESVIDSYAYGVAKLYKSGKLFQGAEFLNTKGIKHNLDYTYYIWKEVEYTYTDYRREDSCDIPDRNNPKESICGYYLIPEEKTGTKMDWVEYDFDNLPTGNYKWKLYAKRPANQPTDFVLELDGGVKTNEWAWWDGSWSYKKEITFTGVVHYNSTIMLNLSRPANMQSDYSDLRFVNGSEDTEIDYYIDWSNTTDFNVSLRLFSADSIYMYYGNAGASGNLSNFNNTLNGVMSNVSVLATCGGSAGNIEGFEFETRYPLRFIRQYKPAGATGANQRMLLAEDDSVLLNSSDSDIGYEMVYDLTNATKYQSVIHISGDSCYLAPAVAYPYIYNGQGNPKNLNISNQVYNTAYPPAANNGAERTVFGIETIERSLATFAEGGEVAGLIVSLNSPTDNYETLNTNVVFNCTTTSASNLLNLSLIIDDVLNYTMYNSSAGQTLLSLEQNITGLSLGSHTWNCQGQDNIGITNGTQRSFDINFYDEINETYNNITYETSNETFKKVIELKSGTTFYSASLIYNGVNYLADVTDLSGGVYLLERKIDIPPIDLNTTHDFNWTFAADAGGGITSQTTAPSKNVSVIKTNITDTGTTFSINFTIYDEDTLEKVSGFFYGTFDWFLGSGTKTQNISYNRTNAINHIFYLIPDNRTFYNDMSLEIGNKSLGYNNRLYDFDEEVLTTGSTEKDLYLSNGSASNIIIEVKDEGLVALEGYYITIKRFYPSLNEYKTVENRRTDEFGQFVAKLYENDVKYKFEFRDTDGDLVKTTNDMTIACRTTICVVPFVVKSESSGLLRYEDLENYYFNLTFDNSTNKFIFTWNDNTGASPTHRLLVTRRSWNGTSVVCNDTSTLLVGNLDCSVGSSKASYTSQIFREASPEVRRTSLSTSVGDLTHQFGLEGLFISFILLMTLILVGLYSPPIAITLYLVGTVFLSVVDVIYVNPAILIAEFVIGIAFIWSFRS